MKLRELQDFADELRGDDPVSNPSHYQLVLPTGEDVEAIDIIRATLGEEGTIAYCRGSALKYLLRAGRKDISPEAQDLRKAAWFLTYGAQLIEAIGED